MTLPMFDPPPQYAMPVTRNSNISVTVHRVDTEGKDKAWPVQGRVWCEFDAEPPVTVYAKVSRFEANIVVPVADANRLTEGTTYRIMADTEQRTVTCLATGAVQRADGTRRL